MSFSIVIPAYNEGQDIKTVLEKLMAGLKARHLNVPVYVIDDGCTDSTAQQAESVVGVTVVKHKRNKGYGAALKTGIHTAQTEWVVTYDSDGQHTPENLDALLLEMTTDADLVIGKREGYKGPWIRQPGKRLIGVVANFLTETKIPDYNSGLRAFRRSKVLQYLHLFPSGFSISTTSTVCFLKEGLNVQWVPITIKERTGTSTVRPRDAIKTLMLIVRLTMMFSPLRVLFPISVGLGLLTTVLLGYELVVHQNVSDASVALISLTCIMFFFGLLADQIAAVRREIGTRSL